VTTVANDAGPARVDAPDELAEVEGVDDLAAYRDMTALARFAWTPFLNNPKLERRLHRITAPTLVAWPSNDKIIAVAHGNRYADLIPKAEFAMVEDCRRHLHGQRGGVKRRHRGRDEPDTAGHQGSHDGAGQRQRARRQARQQGERLVFRGSPRRRAEGAEAVHRRQYRGQGHHYRRQDEPADGNGRAKNFYTPKGSSKAQLLEAKENLQRMLAAVPLTDDERAAVDGSACPASPTP